jgi:hypothetical protein
MSVEVHREEQFDSILDIHATSRRGISPRTYAAEFVLSLLFFFFFFF